MSHIILLNGTSSSGKSTLAKALQNTFDTPYLHVGIDTFIFMLPKAYLNPPLWYTVFEYHWQPDGSLIITTGPLGHQLMAAMHEAIAGLARAGFNIIVDHVMLEAAWLDDCVRLLRDFDVTFVGVRCRLAVVEQREWERKDRTLGQAKAQYSVVHAGKTSG
ncbi:MAG: AAA family ATPase [Chloroflexi bacterium]|nr:AAA family ATPase [Chloroflexota bacterium]